MTEQLHPTWPLRSSDSMHSLFWQKKR